MSGKSKCPACPPQGAPDWMVTYGDLMTLLLCFFVLLFSFSSLESKKFESLKESLRGAFGVLSGTSTTLGKGAKKKPKKKTDSTFEKAVSRILVKVKRKTTPTEKMEMLERAVLEASRAVKLVSQQREEIQEIVRELETPTSETIKESTNFAEVTQETLETKEPRNFPTERLDYSEGTDQNKEEPESANQPLEPPRSKGDAQEYERSDLTEIDIAQGRDQTLLENTGNQRKKDLLSGRARVMEKFHDIEKYRSEDQNYDFRQKQDTQKFLKEYTTLAGMVEKTYPDLSHAVFNLSEELLFKKNEVELKEAAKEKLYRIFQKHYQKDSTSIFQIEAHTDFAQSPSEKYPTTWHLAAVRALRVLDFLFEESDEFDPSRFCIVSFGAYQPKFQYAKDQVELEENRRLEVRMFQTPGGKTNDR